MSHRLSRAKFRAFKCRCGVHRTRVAVVPPLPVGLRERSVHADRYLRVTICNDCLTVTKTEVMP